MKSASPGALVWTVNEFLEKDGEEPIELGIIRCRPNALAHSTCDFSVLCPLDNIVNAQEGVLADFSYIDMKVGRRSALAVLPYIGPNWYHRIAVEFLLHHKIITWKDIQYSLTVLRRLIRAHLSQS